MKKLKGFHNDIENNNVGFDKQIYSRSPIGCPISDLWETNFKIRAENWLKAFENFNSMAYKIDKMSKITNRSIK